MEPSRVFCLTLSSSGLSVFFRIPESPAIGTDIIRPAVFLVAAIGTFFRLGSRDAGDFLAPRLAVALAMLAQLLFLDEFPSDAHYVEYRDVQSHDVLLFQSRSHDVIMDQVYEFGFQRFRIHKERVIFYWTSVSNSLPSSSPNGRRGILPGTRPLRRTSVV